MSEGWISIHRKIKNSNWYKDSQYVHLWLHLLLSACYKDTDVKVGNNIIHLKRGQLLTSRKSLESDVHIQESKIYRILKCFENEQQIEQQKNRKYTIISIINYDMYQQNEQQFDCLLNKKRTTAEQSTNTYNNNNKYYSILLNKYKENPPKNFWEKLHKINNIKKTKEYKMLNEDERNDLFIKLHEIKITKY